MHRGQSQGLRIFRGVRLGPAIRIGVGFHLLEDAAVKVLPAQAGAISRSEARVAHGARRTISTYGPSMSLISWGSSSSASPSCAAPGSAKLDGALRSNSAFALAIAGMKACSRARTVQAGATPDQ